MTDIGKKRTCLHCGIVLTEKLHASGKRKWYTPWGRWHHVRRCNFAGSAAARRAGGRIGRQWKWGRDVRKGGALRKARQV